MVLLVAVKYSFERFPLLPYPVSIAQKILLKVDAFPYTPVFRSFVCFLD